MSTDSMSEKEKLERGMLYSFSGDKDIMEASARCKALCFKYNMLSPELYEERQALMRQIIGVIKGSYYVLSPFQCDYGTNIELGDNFYSNHNLIILDGAKVKFGRNVFIAPNCCFTTAGHPLDAERRGQGLEFALPITVGDDVWIGAGVTVLPGVTIGDRSIIGAGSIVNRDIPSDVIAVGNPCKVLRTITDADRKKHE